MWLVNDILLKHQQLFLFSEIAHEDLESRFDKTLKSYKAVGTYIPYYVVLKKMQALLYVQKIYWNTKTRRFARHISGI